MISGKEWLEDHLENFVRANLGYVPFVDPKSFYVKQLYPPVLERLFALWEKAKEKCKGRTILLPGRDVYLFEIIARVEGYPTIYRQELSSSVCNAYSTLKTPHPWKECFLIDSGANGTIAKYLGVANHAMVSTACGLKYTLGDQSDGTLYGILEAAPKYFLRAKAAKQMNPDGKTAKVVNGVYLYENPLRVVQTLVLPDVLSVQSWPNTGSLIIGSEYVNGVRFFAEAAMLTQHIAAFAIKKFYGEDKQRDFGFMGGIYR